MDAQKGTARRDSRGVLLGIWRDLGQTRADSRGPGHPGRNPDGYRHSQYPGPGRDPDGPTRRRGGHSHVIETEGGHIDFAPLEASIGIRLTLWMCALAPLFTVKRVCTITSLEGDDRARVLEAMGKSPVYAIRQLLLGLKAMLALHLAKDVRVRERLSRVAPEHEETLVSLRRTRAGLDRGRGKDLQGAVNDNAAE